MPSATLEEYLETIYKLSHEGPVRPTRIAESIHVSAPTVTATLKRLESRGLIARDGTGVTLTAEGVSRSLEIVRKHRVAERFLVDVLGLDWGAAHEDACLLEHAMSPRVLEALERFLGEPSECPHGHPIPAADGSVAQDHGYSLADMTAGSVATVLRVAEGGKMLDYLGDLGLRPGVLVRVVSVEPFNGPLTVEIGEDRRAVAQDIARQVIVRMGA